MKKVNTEVLTTLKSAAIDSYQINGISEASSSVVTMLEQAFHCYAQAHSIPASITEPMWAEVTAELESAQNGQTTQLSPNWLNASEVQGICDKLLVVAQTESFCEPSQEPLRSALLETVTYLQDYAAASA